LFTDECSYFGYLIEKKDLEDFEIKQINNIKNNNVDDEFLA